jgi:hypothetical protein
MTTDEAIGRTVREHREKTVRAAAIRSELRRTGEALVAFGRDLQEQPALAHPPHPEAFNLAALGDLVSELRGIDDALDVLRREMREMGLGSMEE